MLSAGAAVVLGATMLIAASLQAWHHGQHYYQPVVQACAAVALACLGVGAARATCSRPVLIVLLSIPWGIAVVRRLADQSDSHLD